MKSNETIIREKFIIDKMIENKIISEDIPFNLTSNIIDSYCQIYSDNFSSKNGNHKNSNKRYARKLAALTLMEFQRNKFETTNTVIKSKSIPLKCGFVYLISNPSFPGTVKVGITKDIIKRLDTYQTYDPYRSYKIEHYEFCENIREKESKILNQFSIDLYKGEWIDDKREDIKKVLFDHWPKAN